MSDVWEHAFDALELLPGEDADGDGQTNLEESFAWTDPFDMDDVIALAIVDDAAGLSVEWEERPGVTYVIEASSDLQIWVPVSEFSPVTGSVPATVTQPPAAGEWLDIWNLWAGAVDGYGVFWRANYGFDGGGSRPPADYEPGGDPDFDGFPNLLESYANTDPFAIGSGLSASLASSGAHVNLVWKGVNGVERYRLEFPATFSTFASGALGGTEFASLLNPPAGSFFGAVANHHTAPFRLTSSAPGEFWSAESHDYLPADPTNPGVAMAAGVAIDVDVDGYAFVRWTGTDGFEYIVRTRLRIGDWYFTRVASYGSHAPTAPVGGHSSYRLRVIGPTAIGSEFTLAEWHHATQSTDPFEDWDGDGIPTVWEAEHGLDATDSADAFEDPDSDVLSNREEWLDGRDPTVPDKQQVQMVVTAPTNGDTWELTKEVWHPTSGWGTPEEITDAAGTFPVEFGFGDVVRIGGRALNGGDTVPSAAITALLEGEAPAYWLPYGGPQTISSPLSWQRVFFVMHVGFKPPPCLLLNDNRDEYKAAADLDDASLLMLDPEPPHTTPASANRVLMFNDLMGDRPAHKHDMIRVSPTAGKMMGFPDSEFHLVRTAGTGELRFHSIKHRDGASRPLNPGLETVIPQGVDIAPAHLRAGAPFLGYLDLAEGIVEGDSTYQLRWVVNGVTEAAVPGTCEIFLREDAFAGAEGFGKFAIRADRVPDAKVVEVKNNSDNMPGAPLDPNSLRWALEDPSNAGPKTITFDKLTGDGNIRLRSTLTISEPFVTIDGRVGSGKPGVCLRDHGLVIAADHVIVRYMRSRPGDTTGTPGAGPVYYKPHKDEQGNDHDCFTIKGARHVILDHCSASWGVDEAISVGEKEYDTDNVTVQWSILSSGLTNSIHSKTHNPKKNLPHGYGSILHASLGAKYSVHHCLYAHLIRRSPRFENKWAPVIAGPGLPKGDPVGGYIDFRYNVLYNWGILKGKPAAGLNFDGGGDPPIPSLLRYNLVGNYYQRGPDTAAGVDLAMQEWTRTARGFYSGNMMNGQPPASQWDLVEFKNAVFNGVPQFPAAQVTLYKNESALFAAAPGYGFPVGGAANIEKGEVIDPAGAGASQSQDPVDAAVKAEFGNGTGSLIDSQNEFLHNNIPGWPSLQN